MMDAARLEAILDRAASCRLLVVGDVMLDKYLWCDVSRISPEAPIPVASVTHETFSIGGAANVAANIASLGSGAAIHGVIGDDQDGELLRQELLYRQIEPHLVAEKERPTTVKTRVVCGAQQLLRFDKENTDPIHRATQERLRKEVVEAIPNANTVVLSDYAKGVFDAALSQTILAECQSHGVKSLVDPKLTTWQSLQGAYLVKPNRKEAEQIAGHKFAKDFANLEEIGHILEDKLQAKVIVTLGEAGMAVFDDDEIVRIPTIATQVYDVAGAGDTVMAALAVALATGATLQEAAFLGNLAAGVVVRKLGTATCTAEELLTQYEQVARASVTRSPRSRPRTGG